MNILIDSLPEHVLIGDREYRINSDFRISILFEIMMMDDTLSPEDKTVKALNLYYGEIPHDIETAVNKMLWFYLCGDQKKKKPEKQFDEETGKFVEVDESEVLDPVYSFEHDAQYIFGAFMEQYRIDLTRVDMHWWKFRALFNSLSDETKFVKIMGYRSIEISGNMSKQQRGFYSRMKELYALPLPEGEQERQDAIIEALMGDGNVDGLL